MTPRAIGVILDGSPPDFVNASMHAVNHALVAAGLPAYRLQRFGPVRLLGRALGRFKINRRLVTLPGRALLANLAWPNDGRTFPYGWCREIIPWIIDCWPHDYHKWEHLLRRNRTRLAFVSSQGSVRYFNERIKGLTCVWMPEACDPRVYSPEKPLAARAIHALELGRHRKPYHDAIAAPLAAAGLKHLFASDGVRTPIFPDQDSLFRGLGDTQVSVCFPKSMTHEKASGGLETVTLRYFESMASRCLIVGHAPSELVDLYGYNPVIEADERDPAGQLLAILRDIGGYQALVDRNSQRLLEVGTGEARARDIIAALKERGFRVETRPQR